MKGAHNEKKDLSLFCGGEANALCQLRCLRKDYLYFGNEREIFGDRKCCIGYDRRPNLAALEQIDLAMKQVGSSLKNLVKMTTFLKDMKDYQGYRDTERKYFLEHAPELVKEPVASTVVQVASLPRKEFLIEIEAIGIL